MATVTVNGLIQDIEQEISLDQFLKRCTISTTGVAVALNDEIIPQSRFATAVIKHGDRIEMVRAVAGG